MAYKYWALAAKAAVYLYNRTPHSAIGKTLYEAAMGEKPDISQLKVWGSVAYKKDYTAKKLEPRAYKYILVGYGPNQYELLDPDNKKTHWARDVVVKENEFFYQEKPGGDLVIEDDPENPEQPTLKFMGVAIPRLPKVLRS